MKIKDMFKKDKDDNQKEKEDEEKKVVDKVLQMYRNSYNAKADLHELWDKCYKAYSGEYFVKNLPDYKSQEISNFIFSTIETVKPIMLADNPKILALPQRPEHQKKSELIQQALDYEWTRAKMFTQLQRACTTGLITGTVPIAILWDSTQDKGLGNVTAIPISPFNFFVDPMATDIDNAEYCGYVTYKNVGLLAKMYPEKAEELKKCASAPTDKYIGYGKDLDNASKQDVMYHEWYLRDYSLEVSIEEEDGQKYEVKKLKYPNGRKIIVAGDVLLEDTENPYQDGKFPFVAWKCYDVPGKFWGMGEIEQLISPVQYQCELMNNILDSAKLMSNPIWILDKNSGVEKNSLTNRNGLVVRKNPGTEVRREAPPSLPAYIQNVIQMFSQHVEQISGVYDVTRGERPTGITAGVAIQALNESAQGRIKLKVQSLEQMLSELGCLWLSRMQQFWESKRSIRIMTMDYNVQFIEADKDDIDGDYDIIIASGSTMPVNKTAKLQQLVQLAQTQAEDGLPMIDRQTILENADLQDVDKILERFDMLKQQQQQQAQAQQEQAMQEQQNQMAQEQQQAEMEKQAEQEKAMQEAQLQHEQANADMQRQMIMKQQELENQKELNKQNNSLQNNTNSVKSNQSEQGSQDTRSVQPSEEEALMQIIELIKSKTPEELAELSKQEPMIAQLIQQLSQFEQS